jgi:hypothetical protein
MSRLVPGGVQDSAGGSGAFGRGAVQEQRDHRRDGERAAESDRDHQHGQDGRRRVCDVEYQRDQADRHQELPGGDRDIRAESCGNAGGEDVHEPDEHGHRQERESGLESGQAAGLLEVEADQEDHAIEAHHEREADRDRNDDGAGAEQVRWHHRIRAARLRDEEHDDGQDRDRQHRQHLGRVETDSATFDDAIDQCCHADDRRELAAPVEANELPRRARDACEQEEGDEPERKVDDEDHPPAHQAQDTAQHRADR